MKLEDTRLWQTYKEKLSKQEEERGIWVEKVYNTAVAQLKDVRVSFRNYTLHDETHVLNVLHAIAGLLGDQIGNLSVGELELLILAASLHDIGMVYTNAEIADAYADEQAYNDFIRANRPELYGLSPDGWDKDVRQWYLRSLHPFRLPDLLNKETWRKVFEACPKDIVPQETMIAVCQAHGEEPDFLRDNPDFDYMERADTDPRFCALLLRLADLLDFDDTRTPKVLFENAVSNAKSVEEWQKHMASLGCAYPASPSTKDLVYSARCTDPGEEHSIREFLDWIDDELNNCRDLQRLCEKAWQHDFPFPLKISRKGITRHGYVSDDFKITMDQAQILKLLTGENLYEDKTVFVRELLQNAVDATLLRGKMEHGFDVESEEARIDLWEWMDNEGNHFFRIDDNGTGMTLNMLKNYFLKVGNSYYTSTEIKRDLITHNCKEDYKSISRFGIGFLSCFLCGIGAEVSTLYFDKNKCEQEAEKGGKNRHFGLRMNITGLNGYYILQSQASKHTPKKPLPAHVDADASIERKGYRCKAGTSIVIRLDPGQMGFISLKEAAKSAICGARMPIYYNGNRIGRTINEIMKEAHELEGKTIYELSSEEKKEFDHCFPYIAGHYPKISVTVTPIDNNNFPVLSGFMGIIMKHELHFSDSTRWEMKDQIFELDYKTDDRSFDNLCIYIYSKNVTHSDWYYTDKWDSFSDFGSDAVSALRKVFTQLPYCPDSPECLGKVWLPFKDQLTIQHAWGEFLNIEQYRSIKIHFGEKRGIPTINSLTGSVFSSVPCISYQGISTEPSKDSRRDNVTSLLSAVFFLEGELQPLVNTSRTHITKLPLNVLVAITGAQYLYCKEEFKDRSWDIMYYDDFFSNREWFELHNNSLTQWILNSLTEKVSQVKEYLHKPICQERSKEEILKDTSSIDLMMICGNATGYIFFSLILSYLQYNYVLSIDYKNGQVISFEDNPNHEIDSLIGSFPPMLFCIAADIQNRRFLCCDDPELRRCITIDHPFTEWLLENAEMLNRQFKQQFIEIIVNMCRNWGKDIIDVVNGFREQLKELRSHNALNIKLFDPLTKDDFWYFEDENEA